MPHHFAIRKNGRIRAVVGSFPMAMQAGDTRLKVAGIGSVSAHPYEQGSGYMSKLMKEAVRSMREEGVHLSVLGGERKRYSHFGYERSGNALDFNVSKKSATIGLAKDAAPQTALRFEKIGENDAARLAEAKRLHDRQLVHAERSPEEFYFITKTWRRELWAILGESGRMAGYLVASPERDRVAELAVESPDLLTEAIRAWVADQEHSYVTFVVPPWNIAYAQAAGRICESVMVRGSYNILVLDWERVVDALLKVKAQTAVLAEGEASIRIRGYGTLRIAVRGGKASCERMAAETDGGHAAAAPDIEWDALQATRILFGPLPQPYAEGVPENLAPLLSSWLPLPLHWPEQDQV